MSKMSKMSKNESEMKYLMASRRKMKKKRDI